MTGCGRSRSTFHVLTRDLQEGDGKKTEEGKKRGRKKAEKVEEETLVDSDDEIGERAIQGVDFPTVLRVR